MMETVNKEAKYFKNNARGHLLHSHIVGEKMGQILQSTFLLLVALNIRGTFEQRIIGGQEVFPYSIKYQASIQYNNRHYCGATLIRPQWIVSAAHCYKPPVLIRVVLSEHNLLNREGFEQEFNVSRIFYHKAYNYRTFNNDIMLLKEKSGSLKVPKRDLEDHLKTMHTDDQRHKQRVIPPDMPPIPQPEHQFDDSPPRWSEIAVRKARAASAPGPNGVPYRLYKNAPDVLRFLWKQMKVAWKKQNIPKAWRRAGGVLIPKEKDASNID
ncbi:hypothetical protein SKAU_G00098100 [Synaphobranchus kaupii]|uniref:trypsin n=1 Tax=Synaphobranchus kaupii TaxID=118154 RepID=A0A9Q1J638_SYNKA|nr:hypothetical protein SKAU_G00098100 [Synaphobranchus kaupii]